MGGKWECGEGRDGSEKVFGVSLSLPGTGDQGNSTSRGTLVLLSSAVMLQSDSA
jgi:hypothetical protein